MRREAVVIGTSHGGFDALPVVLSRLPAEYPAPVLIVQHTSADSDNYIVTYLNEKCALNVKEAEEKERALPGWVYFAPPNYHLLVERDGTLSLSTEERVNYARPSVDVLFSTAADAFGKNLIGVVLTGANKDGSEGIKAVKEAGGVAIVQSPETALSPSMPLAAIAATEIDYVAALDEIWNLLIELAR